MWQCPLSLVMDLACHVAESRAAPDFRHNTIKVFSSTRIEISMECFCILKLSEVYHHTSIFPAKTE